jgi:hypothetical protein
MNKKIIMPIALLLLVSLSYFVVAEGIPTQQKGDFIFDKAVSDGQEIFSKAEGKELGNDYLLKNARNLDL